MRGYFNGKGVLLEIDGDDGLEPGTELLRLDNLFDYPQAVVPYVGVFIYSGLVQH